jgi:hypothetical protein
LPLLLLVLPILMLLLLLLLCADPCRYVESGAIDPTRALEDTTFSESVASIEAHAPAKAKFLPLSIRCAWHSVTCFGRVDVMQW